MSSREFADLSDDQLVAIDAACDVFESALLNGDNVSIEEHLTTAVDIPRLPLLRELLEVELAFKMTQGTELSQRAYERRFPEAKDVVYAAFNEARDQGANARTLEIKRDETQSCLEVQSPNENAGGKVPGDLPREFGRYRLMGLLGKGGMGSVYLAHDTQLDRQVALKMPEFDEEAPEHLIERFYREARSMASVMHPNLCTIHDVGEHEGHHYLTMTFIDGESLTEQIKRDGPLDSRAAATLVRQLALAIQPAHEAGVIHRDLKPSNVMIDRQGEPFITDFGLASRKQKGEAELTHSGLVIGSPAYMAPEQVGGSRAAVGPHTDVYALGVVLYQSLCGRLPYQGNALEVLGRITSGRPPTPPSDYQEIDSRVEEVCLRAMAHKVKDRYATASELAAALAGCNGEIGVHDETFETTQETTRKSRLALVWASLTLALLVIALISSSSFFTPRTKVNELVDKPGPERPPQVEPDDVTPPSPTITNPRPESAGLVASVISPYAKALPPESTAAIFLSEEYCWTSPKPVTWSGATEKNTYAPFVTADHCVMLLGKLLSKTTVDIVICRRETAKEPWGASTRLPEKINTEYKDGQPTLSGDGTTLVFASSRSGGHGSFDLWIAQRASLDEDFGDPVNLGPEVNGDGDDSSPALSSDGLVLFFQSSRPGYGGLDIWKCVRESVEEPFGAPTNLGESVNSIEDESEPSISLDGTVLLHRHNGHIHICTRSSVEEKFANRVPMPPTMFHARGACLTGNSMYYVSLESGERTIWSTHRVRRSSLTSEVAGSARSVGSASGLLPLAPRASKRSTGQFYDTGESLGTANSRAVAAGDVDNDGDVDILVVNRGEPHRVLLNNGEGAFSKGQELATGACIGIQLADLDGDKDLDAILSYEYDRAVILLNNGVGEFEQHQQTEPFAPCCLALGDIDADGDLDAVFGGGTKSSGNRVYTNDGNANFEVSQEWGKRNTFDVGLEDLDGDGDLDIFAVNYKEGNSVWLNDGKGYFTDNGQRYGKGENLRVALADIDNDGDIDACTTSQERPSELWLNNGRAGFAWCPLSPADSNSTGVAIADFNGDGKNDILIGNGQLRPGGQLFPNQICINKNGQWEISWLGVEPTTSFAIADFDGDGDLDAFLANYGHPNRVWFNRNFDEPAPGPTFFRDSGQRMGHSSSNAIELADLDMDGDLDAVVANMQFGSTKIWKNDGNGRFSASFELPEPVAAHDVALGDLDNDDDVDVILTNKSGPNRVWLNDSGRTFELSPQEIGNSSSNRVTLADFDKDGDLDAWVGNFNPYHDRLWINEGNGVFTDSGQDLGAGRTYSVRAFDIDGDGDLDVLKGTGSNHANTLWLNDGEGRFTRSDEVLSGRLASNGFSSGDLNGDGFPDLYESGWIKHDRIWFNDGRGHYQQSSQIGHWIRSRRTHLVDLDNDGDLDVFIGNQLHLPNAICLNDGEGVFSAPVQFLGNCSTCSFALGDLDGDGDLDAFTANTSGQPNRVWLNVLETADDN